MTNSKQISLMMWKENLYIYHFYIRIIELKKTCGTDIIVTLLQVLYTIENSIKLKFSFDIIYKMLDLISSQLISFIKTNG